MSFAPDKVWTTGKIAKLLCCSTGAVNKLINSGQLKAYRLGVDGHRRVRDEELQEFLTRIGFYPEREKTE